MDIREFIQYVVVDFTVDQRSGGFDEDLVSIRHPQWLSHYSALRRIISICKEEYLLVGLAQHLQRFNLGSVLNSTMFCWGYSAHSYPARHHSNLEYAQASR